jgi:hypothetical protein
MLRKRPPPWAATALHLAIAASPIRGSSSERVLRIEKDGANGAKADNGVRGRLAPASRRLQAPLLLH